MAKMHNLPHDFAFIPSQLCNFAHYHFKIAMTDYLLDCNYYQIVYEKDAVNYTEFERCTFDRCDFSTCTFVAVTFIDCIFKNCNFSGAKINYVAFRTATFQYCQIQDVNFSMCDKLIFDITFDDCNLDFSKFYALKIKGTTFKNCSLIAVDFMSADLTGVVFDRCNLYRSEFKDAVADKANFKTSLNYTIDPEKTKLKKAIFALTGIKGLLFKHDIIVK